mgnify:CR=1 FL=1
MGKLIVIEGTDGSGKSTQFKLLTQRLEQEGCANPDEPAGCFGDLMAELFVLQEDMWAGDLRAMGQSLGRFIYLLDAAVDYHKDKRRKRYNP